MGKNNILKTYLKFGVLSLTIFLGACNKDTKESVTETIITAGKGDSKIAFIIDGIESSKEAPAKSSKGVTSGGEVILANSKIVSVGDMDYLVTISEKNTTGSGRKTVDSRSKHSSGAPSAVRNTENIRQGRTYRIVLFNTDAQGNPTTVHAQAEGTVGNTSLQIQADADRKYRWYAYTYNNTSTIPAFNATSGTVPVLPSGDSQSGRQDFAYASGLITTSETEDNNITRIVFTRKTALFEVEVNSKGMFSQLRGFSPMIKSNSGVFRTEFRLQDSTHTAFSSDLPGGSVKNYTSDRDNVSVGVDSVVTPNTKWRFKFYSPADGQTASSLVVSADTIKLLGIQVKASDGLELNSARDFYDKSFPFPSFVPEPGKIYRISLKLIESPIVVGNTKWARGNTWRDGDGLVTPEGFNEYLIRFDNPLYDSRYVVPFTDYFTDDIYDVVDGRNICRLIYPRDTWDLPTQQDFRDLAAYTNKSVIVLRNSWFLRVIPTVPAQGAPSYPNGFLDFVPVGYQTTLQGYVYDYYPNSTNYPSTVGYYRTRTMGTFAQFLYSNNPQAQIIQNVSRNSYTYAPVRCVRRQ